MRRRTFRPALESLDLRITPSDVAGPGAAVVTVGSPSTSPQSDGSLWEGVNNNPNWMYLGGDDTPYSDPSLIFAPSFGS